MKTEIRKERTHFAKSGKEFHEYAGPQLPNPGPTLPILEITVLTDSEKPTPKNKRIVQPIRIITR